MRDRNDDTGFWFKIRRLAQLPEWLDWLLSVVEPLIVLGIALLVGYVACFLVLKADQPEEQKRLITLLKELSAQLESLPDPVGRPVLQRQFEHFSNRQRRLGV